jgi:hypothetical protein
MLDVKQLKNVARHVQLCVVKVAKCKQSNILTSIRNIKSIYNYTHCQRTKDSSSIYGQ